MKSIIFSLCLVVCAFSLSACNQPHASLPVKSPSREGTRLVNVDGDGLALQGYDPVAYFRGGKPEKGLAEFTAVHEGAAYHFASAENKAAFEQDPANYAPQFGGYCAYGVASGGLFPVDVNTGTIVGGRLILNKNTEVAELFAQDAKGNLIKADRQWPDLVKDYGQ